MKLMFLNVFVLIFFGTLLHAQESDAARRNTIRFGTETEIAALIQSLRTEGADYLDDEIIALAANTRNRNILAGAFAFFGEREKGGLENRAILALEEWDEEETETVLAAIEYIGRVKAAAAAPVLKELLDMEERRFMNAAFLALGRVSAGPSADDTALYLVDFYENRVPGDEFRRNMIAAMGDTESSIAVPFLASLASNNEERFPLRIAALEAIAKIGDPAGLDAALECISARDPYVRAAAVAALGPFSGPQVDEAILEAFRDSDHRTRIAAARASRQRQLAAAVPYLQFRAERRDEVPAVREESVRALGAIGGSEAIAILEGLFTTRNNPNQIRIAAGEMLMENEPGRFLDVFLQELEEARSRNLTPLYNGLLGILGKTRAAGMEAITRRLMQDRGVVERSFALDMAANNNLVSLAGEIRAIAADRNEALARKAQRTLESMGLSGQGAAEPQQETINNEQ